MNLPPEIWADQLEDDGMDTSLLRVLLLSDVATPGCRHTSYEYGFGKRGHGSGDNSAGLHGNGTYSGSMFSPSTWGDGPIYSNSITNNAISPREGDGDRDWRGDAN